MDTVLQDVRYAVRTLARMRGVAAVAILTLALGIGATTTMFSVVYGALLRPVPFAEPDRLVILFTTSVTPRDGLTRLRWSRPHIIELQASVTSFESVGSFTPALLSTSGHGDPEQVDGEVASPGYFQALRVTPIAGRVFRPEEDTVAGAQPVTIISARLWKRRFASDRAIVGGTLRVNEVPLTIIGILPDGFAGLSGKAELWIPPPMAARLTYAEYLTTPQKFIAVVARLKHGVTLGRANAELAAIGPRFAGVGSPDAVWSAAAVPIGDARIDATVRRSALVLLGAAACVLLIACVNVASLLLARARMRRREMAVRLAVGSSRGRLIQQLLTEGLLMAAVAGACGTALAAWGTEAFARTAPEIVPIGRNNYGLIAAFGRPALDPGVLMFALAMTLGTTMLFALVPALEASRPELATALKENDRGGGGQGRALSMLVISEVALACLLLTVSGLLIESFARIQNRRTGFVADNVLTFWVRPPASRYTPADGPATLERLLTSIQAVPGVESAAVNRCTPFTGCSRSTVFFPDRRVDRADAPGVGRHYVSADYFRTLGIPLLAGRTLTAADRAGTAPVAVVNETGARRFWPGETAIGKRVWFGTTTGPFADRAHAVEIVGVVGDVKYEGVEQPDSPYRADFYTSYLQFSFPDTMMIVKARGAADALPPAMRTAVASVDPALPIYDAMTLDERIGAAISRPRFNATLLTAFAGAAVLLAAIGVYGVLSYSVSSRMREIGVRLALGADARRVVSLVLGQGLRLAAIGAGIGLAAALAAARFLQGLVAGVSASDPRLLAASAVLMTAVAGLAAFLPARRASAIDPIVVLREP
ncbi:MAG TPA: ABC transporter permease [Vicinamibacterales bacterium]|nr:ABC transporter permease [Vicinamibacterales bacterium]